MQCRILERGIKALKAGGRLVYSTCSINPVEDEAVVSSALREHGSDVELLDLSHELPTLKRRPGVSQWGLMVRDRVC